MSIKLGKKEFPAGHTANDFRCFGPPATKDGEFDGCKIADLGCFSQGPGGTALDSNKYYHGAIVQSTKDNSYWAYFQWGRTGASSADFQFVQCSSEAEAQMEFVAQLRSKNDKRGQWTTIAGIKTLQAKPGKDCYLVRAQATRSTGLPDAKTIQMNDGAKQQPAPAQSVTAAKAKPALDPQTMSLMQDLNLATVAYAKGAMSNESLPTQTSIDEGRQILAEATKVVAKIGADVGSQVKSKDLIDLTSLLYSRIPKTKPVGAAATTWILSQSNIINWSQDLDAFEQALYTTLSAGQHVTNPLDGYGIELEWLDQKSAAWVYSWLPTATRNKHHGIGSMKIKHVWRVKRPTLSTNYEQAVARIAKEVVGKPKVGAMHQTGISLSALEKQAHVCKLIHGSRSVNISGILKTGLRVATQLKASGVAINGAMFGAGAAYFASDWKKSAGYCSLSNSYYAGGSGRVKGREAFMFVSSVILGHPFVAKAAYGFVEPPKGHHSVYGKAGATSGLMNDEHMIYSLDQHTLDYLVEFTA